MRLREDVAREGTMLTPPNLLCVVVAAGLSADCDTLLKVFSDSPGTLAKSPVIVVLVRAAVHHSFTTCWSALNSIGSDVVAHTVAWKDADRNRAAAVG